MFKRVIDHGIRRLIRKGIIRERHYGYDCPDVGNIIHFDGHSWEVLQIKDGIALVIQC